MKLKLTFFSLLVVTLFTLGCGSSSSNTDSSQPAGPVLSAWTRLVGVASANTIGWAVAVDGDGYSYTTGYTTGIIDTTRTGTVNEDVFVARYDRDGTRLWIKQMGVDGRSTHGRGIAVDASGNSYVAGWTEANLVAGSGASTGTQDFFIAKYDKNGTRVWVKQLGVATKETTGLAVAVDADGNSYVTGYTKGDLDGEGAGTLTGTHDIFVAKYDTSGTLQWVKQLGATGCENYGNGIAVDQNGNCYVTGKATGDIHTIGSGLTGSDDVFIAKYDTSGDKKWVIQKGASGRSTYGWGIAVDASGNSYVTGFTNGNLLVGSGLSIGTADVFVMKYNSSGELQWLKQTGVQYYWTEGFGIALDSAGNCYVAGITQADLDGTGPGTNTGDMDVFVISYDKDGTIRMIKQMGTAQEEFFAYGIAATTNGTCIVAGDVDADFDGQSCTGSTDAFITTKLNQ